jgi:uncharacterized membrane protein YgdD (TMEM256/DUF423 family)
MTKAPRAAPALAALLGFVAVVAGAYGDHGLKDPDAQRLMRIGAQYGLIHALAVFAALGLFSRAPRTSLVSAWLFLVGQILFSVLLYLMALTGNRTLGIATPFGGLAMMAGWLALALAALRRPIA